MQTGQFHDDDERRDSGRERCSERLQGNKPVIQVRKEQMRSCTLARVAARASVSPRSEGAAANQAPHVVPRFPLALILPRRRLLTGQQLSLDIPTSLARSRSVQHVALIRSRVPVGQYPRLTPARNNCVLSPWSGAA